VSIMPQAEEATNRFISERREHVKKMGFKESRYLIPNLTTGKDMCYSSNHFRKLKKRLQEASGIKFKIKDYRSTFASLTVQRDSSLLPEVSQQLGHSSVVTTQRFYADMNLTDAGNKLRNAWSKNEGTKTVTAPKGSQSEQKYEPTKPTTENPIKVLIKPKEYMTGYC
jgi:integrase